MTEKEKKLPRRVRWTSHSKEKTEGLTLLVMTRDRREYMTHNRTTTSQWRYKSSWNQRFLSDNDKREREREKEHKTLTGQISRRPLVTRTRTEFHAPGQDQMSRHIIWPQKPTGKRLSSQVYKELSVRLLSSLNPNFLREVWEEERILLLVALLWQYN